MFAVLTLPMRGYPPPRQGRKRIPGSATMRSKRGHSKSRLGHDVIARCDGQSASALDIHVEELPIALHGSPGNEDRVDVAGIRTRHYSANGIVQREYIQAVRAQHDDVGLFTRSERTRLVSQSNSTCPINSGKLQHIPHREQVLALEAPAVESTLVDQCALALKSCSHLAEHITAHICFDIHAQTWPGTKSEYSIQGGHTMAHLHFDGG